MTGAARPNPTVVLRIWRAPMPEPGSGLFGVFPLVHLLSIAVEMVDGRL